MLGTFFQRERSQRRDRDFIPGEKRRRPTREKSRGDRRYLLLGFAQNAGNVPNQYSFIHSRYFFRFTLLCPANSRHRPFRKPEFGGIYGIVFHINRCPRSGRAAPKRPLQRNPRCSGLRKLPSDASASMLSVFIPDNRKTTSYPILGEPRYMGRFPTSSLEQTGSLPSRPIRTKTVAQSTVHWSP